MDTYNNTEPNGNAATYKKTEYLATRIWENVQNVRVGALKDMRVVKVVRGRENLVIQ